MSRPFRKARDSITGDLMPKVKSTGDTKSNKVVESLRKCFSGLCCNKTPMDEFSSLRDEIDGLKETIGKLTQEKEMWRKKYNETLEHDNFGAKAALKRVLRSTGLELSLTRNGEMVETLNTERERATGREPPKRPERPKGPDLKGRTETLANTAAIDQNVQTAEREKSQQRDQQANREQCRESLHGSDHQLRTRNVDVPPRTCSSPSKRATSSATSGKTKEVHWAHANAGPGEIFTS